MKSNGTYKISAIADTIIVRRTLTVTERPQEIMDGTPFQVTHVIATWELGQLLALEIRGIRGEGDNAMEVGSEYKPFSPIPHMRMQFAPAWAREAAEANKPSA